jgi:hypothetical protein
MWFRRDLRVADQHVLRAADDHHDAVVALFVLDPVQLASPGSAPRGCPTCVTPSPTSTVRCGNAGDG